MIARRCDGMSSDPSGRCPLVAVYVITVGSVTRATCGRHAAWSLRRVLVPGRSATVEMINPAATS